MSGKRTRTSEESDAPSPKLQKLDTATPFTLPDQSAPDTVHPSFTSAEAKERIDTFLESLKATEQKWQHDRHVSPSASVSSVTDAKVLAAASQVPVTSQAGGIRHDVDHSRTFISMKALIATPLAQVLHENDQAALVEVDELSSTTHRLSPLVEQNKECVLDIEGALEDVAMAFGLVVKRVNDEPLDQASFPGSRSTTLRFVVPNSRVAPVIGKAGSRLRDVSEASGARLSVTQAVLPGTHERLLTLVGVADACHIAIFHVGSTILEHADRLPGLPPPSVYSAEAPVRSLPGAPLPGTMPPALQINTSFPGMYNGMPSAAAPVSAMYSPFTPAPFSAATTGSLQSQQLFVPNELVGGLIGSKGRAVNELREQSGCQIKILDATSRGEPGSDGLIIVTGPAQNLQRCIQMIRQRVERESKIIAAAAQTTTLPPISLL